LSIYAVSFRVLDKLSDVTAVSDRVSFMLKVLVNSDRSRFVSFIYLLLENVFISSGFKRGFESSAGITFNTVSATMIEIHQSQQYTNSVLYPA
jgi:hypothetical protein